MAVTVTAVLAGTNTKSWDITATADGDTSASITHGLGAAPALVYLAPLLAQAYTSQWQVTSVSSTVITLTKGTASGSGNASAQVRVYADRPHSISL